MHATSMRTGNKALSVVAPCYNEIDGIAEFHRRVSAACHASVGSSHEIVLINDGSTDGTLEALMALAVSDPHVMVIDLAQLRSPDRPDGRPRTVPGRSRPGARCRPAGPARAACRHDGRDGSRIRRGLGPAAGTGRRRLVQAGQRPQFLPPAQGITCQRLSARP